MICKWSEHIHGLKVMTAALYFRLKIFC